MKRWPLLLCASIWLPPLSCASPRHQCAAPMVRHHHHACVTAEFRDTSLRVVLERISLEARREIVLAPGIEDRVSVDYRGCPWRLAAEIAAMSAGCVVREDGIRLLVRRPEPVTLAFVHTDLAEAIRTLAAHGDYEAAVAQDVKGEVSLAFVKWQWNAALSKLVRETGYGMVQEGFDCLVVGRDTQPRMEARVFPLGALRPPEWLEAYIHTDHMGGRPLRDPAQGINLVEALRYMLTRHVDAAESPKTLGRLDYVREGNQIVVVDTPAVLDRIGGLIGELQVGQGQ